MSDGLKAEEMAAKLREISVAEFFEKNRHLLGFDNKRKALLTSVKEAVDNSMDACEEARILPEINVELVDMGNERFRMVVEDNGPGIVKKHIPNVFAKLLYGSKFYKLSQSRGQQGIGISAAVLYSQLTTGRPTKILSRISDKFDANYYELHIDTRQNKPEIVKEEAKKWERPHGTRVEMDLEATYQQGSQSVDEYIKQTAIINPHLTLTYTNPKAEQVIYARVTQELPKAPVEIKPHPYGVELGMLMNMLKAATSRTLQGFLTTEFSRVGSSTAKEICANASLLPGAKPAEISREQTERLIEGIRKTKIMAPPSDCISPIGAELLEKGLRKEINAEFYCSTTRPPSVYRGNPFVIEAAAAYGGELPSEEAVKLLRFANRVPLLYQQGGCAITDTITKTNWKPYGLQQSQGALPAGPAVLLVHIASVWVPFTSEAKEAVAHYPEIKKEIKLALQEVGRKLSFYIRKKGRIKSELKKRSYIKEYIPHISSALKEIIEDKTYDEAKVTSILTEMLEQERGVLEDIEFSPEKNPEYDEKFALETSEERDELEEMREKDKIKEKTGEKEGIKVKEEMEKKKKREIKEVKKGK